ALQAADVGQHGVENAAVFALACGARFGRTAVAEQALEDDLRITLHRQRRGRRRPRDRIRVDAAVADAADAERAYVFDAELERGQGARLTDLVREHLVDRDAALDVLALGALRMCRAQVDGRRARVVAGALFGPQRSRHAVIRARDHGDV